MMYVSVYLTFLILFAAAEVMHRILKVSNEITRKILHIGIGLLAVWWSQDLSRMEFVFITASFMPIMLISIYINFFRSIHVRTRVTYGELFYIAGLLIIALVSYSDSLRFQTALFVLIFPDAFAGTATYISKKTKKTIFHVAVFMIVCTVILLQVHMPISAVSLAIILSIVELVSTRGLDNLTVPTAYLLLTSL